MGANPALSAFRATAPFSLPDFSEALTRLHSIRNRTHEDGTRQDLKQIQDYHREIIRLHVSGLRDGEIAAIMECTEQTVARALASRIVQDHIIALRVARDMQKLEAREKLEAGMRAAAESVAELAADPTISPRVRLAAASDLLDRTGLPRVSRSESTNTTNVHVGIEHIKRLAAETASNPNFDTVELDFVEVVSEGAQGGEAEPEKSVCQVLSLSDSAEPQLPLSPQTPQPIHEPTSPFVPPATPLRAALEAALES